MDYLRTLNPALVAWLGAFTGWFSADRIARARDSMQLGAATVAFLVSICALILTGPAAWRKVITYFHRATNHRYRRGELPLNRD